MSSESWNTNYVQSGKPGLRDGLALMSIAGAEPPLIPAADIAIALSALFY
jgi:hypothetical protein